MQVLCLSPLCNGVGKNPLDCVVFTIGMKLAHQSFRGVAPWHGPCLVTLASADQSEVTMIHGSIHLPPLERVVLPDLQAFLSSLSHLPVEVQLDLLRDATKQISEAVEQTLA